MCENQQQQQQLDQKPYIIKNSTLTEKFPILSAALKQKTAKNDVQIWRETAFGKYRNVICVVCNEWICSRNRKSHIESHLNYRPFKCSHCEYSCRREIFMRQHIKSRHCGLEGQVVCLNIPNDDIENEVDRLAEDCLTSTQKAAVQILTTPINANHAVMTNRPVLVIQSVREIRPHVINRNRQRRTCRLNLDRIFNSKKLLTHTPE